MKIANKNTKHILLKAYTTSDWDTCDFAILRIDEAWKKELRKRLKLVEFIDDMSNFASVLFRDSVVSFYATDEDDMPHIDTLLGDKNWQFVTFENNETNLFNTPTSTLNLYQMVVCKGGYAYFQAFGKHTGDEFYTDDFNLNTLIERL
ncbi:MAG: hypothetical protein Q4C98_04470 [Capnocytophaga sp.]|nr:hypothetical protein [Capnocytophaga sp.]